MRRKLVSIVPSPIHRHLADIAATAHAGLAPSAAELGHGQAQLMLGRYLAEGAAGEPDPAEARRWFEQVAAQGIEEAQADLAALSLPTLQ